MALPFVTVMVSTFAPASHVGELSLAISVSPNLIATVAALLSAVALTLLVALVVVAVYVTVSLSNAGDNVSEPIDNPDKFALKGLRPPV